MFVYVTEEEEMHQLKEQEQGSDFSHVGKRLFYYCMSMGNNNLICFHSHALV